jgi:hypothetical protein
MSVRSTLADPPLGAEASSPVTWIRSVPGSGGAVTVTAADPDTPSLVAVMFAVPGATPVTVPDALTVAAAVLSELHATTRPVSTLFDASRITAVAVVACVAGIEDDPSVTVTEATGAFDTVSAAEPTTPSLVARMFALPAETAVTVPDAFTVATAVLLELHVMTRPVRILLDASRVTADAVVV